MPETTRAAGAVRTDAWKERFLSALTRLESIQALSKEINKNLSLGEVDLDTGPLVRNILDQYEKRELYAARQYYNNSHVIGFWKWYNNKLGELIGSGRVDGDFPVFSVSNSQVAGAITIESHGLDYFYGFRCEDVPDWVRWKSGSQHKARSEGKETSFARLVDQLHLLNAIVKKSTLFFYDRYILEQESKATSYFDDYRIHKFLDRNLFRTPDGQTCDAPFEGLFFSNNLNELEVFLNYRYDHRYELRLDEVAGFLARQRKYYMTLALSIGVEDNAYLNTHRHLLYYDPVEEVVVMPSMSKKMHDYLHEELVLKTGMTRMDGCPFARSKGVSGNAVNEVYARFDDLMLKLVSHWAVTGPGDTGEAS